MTRHGIEGMFRTQWPENKELSIQKTIISKLCVSDVELLLANLGLSFNAARNEGCV